MEGACETAEIAAMEILEDLGLESSVEAMRVRKASRLRQQKSPKRKRPKRARRGRSQS